MPLISAIAKTGRNRMNSRKSVMNRPKEPRNVTKSTQVGSYQPQLLGRKSCVSEVMAMTKRSNHMPTFTNNEAMNSTHMFRRQTLNQKIWGVITLHDTMIQYAQAYCPKARFTNANDS